jgi:sortase (surface protein transpeptidase)
MARMQDDPGHLGVLRRPRAKFALILAAVLIAGGGTAIGVALSSRHHAPQPSRSVAGATSPGSSPASAPTPASSVPLPWAGETAQQLEAAQGPTLPASVPVSLQIPALGVSSKVMRLGLASDGTMQVPPLFGQPSGAGWYEYSPTPGQPGPSVIVGHVDTYRGPSVFYRLGAARPGEEVDVGLADGTTAVFRVTGVREYSKSSFPSRAVYGPTGNAALRLITCGGDFDPATRHYLGSTVVFASLVSGQRG